MIHLGKVHKLDRNTSKTKAYQVKVVSSSSSESNKYLQERANRLPYKPTLRDITEDETNLFNLMEEFECAAPMDTNNNPLQK